MGGLESPSWRPTLNCFEISSRQACGEHGIGCSRSLPGLSFQLPHQGNDDDDDDDDDDGDDDVGVT